MRAYEYKHIYIYVCVPVFVYIYMCVCACVCIYIYVCVCVDFIFANLFCLIIITNFVVNLESPVVFLRAKWKRRRKPFMTSENFCTFKIASGNER